MTDMGQTNLREPEHVDWDSAFTGSKYTPPPPAIGPDGKAIVYQAKVVEIKESEGKGLDAGYLNYEINLRLVGAGPADGTQIRTWASTRTFTRKNAETGEFENIKGNPNALGKFLKGVGLQAKPQSNSDYRAAARMASGKTAFLTVDWEARNRESGETVKGYLNFPEDPENPGSRKAILKTGDHFTTRDYSGNVTGVGQVKSEVLFANARVKTFLAAPPKAK